MKQEYSSSCFLLLLLPTDFTRSNVKIRGKHGSFRENFPVFGNNIERSFCLFLLSLAGKESWHWVGGTVTLPQCFPFK
jgi:hypothetical protein